MTSTIRVTPISNMPGYYEFDYKIPQTGQRIRRKIKASNHQCLLLQGLLADILVKEYDKEKAFTYIHTESSYIDDSTFLEEAINSLYYSYCDKIPANVNESEIAKRDFLNSIFPLNQYDGNFFLLGRIGVGKSTIIKKASYFWGNENISFPFTDTSRTSSFPTDYCFIPNSTKYKFLALFKPSTIVDIRINECIERAVYKLIELTILPKNDTEQIDAVFSSFMQDTSQTFDIRYSLGRYIKTTSQSYKKPENQDTVQFWTNLFTQFKDIVGYIISFQNIQDTKNTDLYQLKYSDAIKAKDEKEPIYKGYLYILKLINERRKLLYDNLINELKNNSAIIKETIKCDLEDDLIPYFYCEITDIDSNSFHSFIKAFTAKKSSEFGHSLFNLVDHLQIEIPLNPKIRLPRKDFSFILRDSVGIAHTDSNTGGFENSTRLSIENADSVIIVDDARTNGDNNASTIIRHLSARIDPSKIAFAFTFFDELEKEDFEEDEDKNEQRISYLIATETNTIKNAVTDPSLSARLISRLNKDNSFFLNGLMDNNTFESIENMLAKLIIPLLTIKNEYVLYKIDSTKPFIVYDYKKLPLLYKKALDEFNRLQKDIYITAPPHYKTTELVQNWADILYQNNRGIDQPSAL